MQTIRILDQSINVSRDKYDIFKDLLKLLNIKYEIEVKEDIETTLDKYNASVRLKNVIKQVRQAKPHIISIQDLVEESSLFELVKSFRHFGRKSMWELAEICEDLELNYKLK